MAQSSSAAGALPNCASMTEASFSDNLFLIVSIKVTFFRYLCAAHGKIDTAMQLYRTDKHTTL